MLVYSKKIVSFINDIKITLKYILAREVGLQVRGDRFYNLEENCSYPINVVVFNDKKMLGYFDSQFYELGFHECLMRQSQEQLENIIRHEVAHYMTFIEYGGWIEPHGRQFREFCRRMGWPEDVQRATSCLDDEVALPNEEENAVLRKVQKLMALAGSSNQHEAEQAMIKSQQLLLKHNISSESLGDSGEEKIYLKRILKQKRANAKMRAIATILGTFFVNTVYNRQEGAICLEIVGSATNIEIAEYVANTLELELENLWQQAKKLPFAPKGTVAKNSFLLGVAQGYCNKVDHLKKQCSSQDSHALIALEKKLRDARDMVYPRLGSSKSQAQHCNESARLGQQAGRALTINPGVGNSAKDSGSYLPFLH